MNLEVQAGWVTVCRNRDTPFLRIYLNSNVAAVLIPRKKAKRQKGEKKWFPTASEKASETGLRFIKRKKALE